MLSNCDYIMMLNQASVNWACTAAEYQLNVSLTMSAMPRSRSGLLFAGKSIIPFVDKFPRDTELYKMITTKLKKSHLFNRVRLKTANRNNYGRNKS